MFKILSFRRLIIVRLRPGNSFIAINFSENTIFTSPFGEMEEITISISGLFSSIAASVTPSNDFIEEELFFCCSSGVKKFEKN
jgi:hypothetical protein